MAKLIESREYIFEVDQSAGLRKLTSQQFSSSVAALLREPIANAIDAQGGTLPVISCEHSLRKGTVPERWSVQNDAENLLDDELLGLHYIGRSAKSDKGSSVGRFGIGFLAALNENLGVRKIALECRYKDVPVVIEYDLSDSTKPMWMWRLRNSDGARHTKIIYYFRDEQAPPIEAMISEFLETITFPIKVNGIVRQNRREILRDKSDVITTLEGERLTIVHVMRTWDIDSIEVYVKGFLVESTPSYRFTHGDSGDKMAQNYHGEPFVPFEDIVVDSGFLNVTLGRDRIVRDEEFDALKDAIQGLRARSLVSYFQRPTLEHDWNAQRDRSELCLANIWSMKYKISEYLRGAGTRTKGPFDALIERLVDEPLFFLGAMQRNAGPHISLREIWHQSKDVKFCFYTLVDEGRINKGLVVRGVVTLVEDPYFESRWFGGHRKRVVADVLARVLEELDVEVVHLSEVERNPKAKKFASLVAANRLEPNPILLQQARHRELNEHDSKLIATLESRFNQPWSSEVLQDHFGIKVSVSFIPISEFMTDDLVMLLSDPGSGSLKIGLNLQHPVTEWAKRLRVNGELLLIPSICLGISRKQESAFAFVDSLGVRSEFDPEAGQPSGHEEVGKKLHDRFVGDLVRGFPTGDRPPRRR